RSHGLLRIAIEWEVSLERKLLRLPLCYPHAVSAAIDAHSALRGSVVDPAFQHRLVGTRRSVSALRPVCDEGQLNVSLAPGADNRLFFTEVPGPRPANIWAIARQLHRALKRPGIAPVFHIPLHGRFCAVLHWYRGRWSDVQIREI